MESGVAYFPTDYALDPGAVARLVEERGHRWLFFPEHTHIPASRETPYPAGGDLPHMYWHTYDLFVACTAALAATSHLRVGTGICLVIERDPIVTAKEVASIDHLSGGRFEFGVGAGWNREEMLNHGTDPRQRMAILAERVKAMKAIWTEEEASFSGKHVNFERIWSWPKPLQKPYPPILVGGNGPTVLDRVLDFGDAWLPNWVPGATLERIPELRERAQAAGREEIAVYVFGPPRDAAALEQCMKAGVSRVMFWLPSARRDRIESSLDKTEAVMSEALGLEESGRAMEPAEARARLSGARVAHLATADAAGVPHLVPICFALSDDVIYSAVDAKPKRTIKLRRLANVRANPRVAVLADFYDDEDWRRLWWVRADGAARVLQPENDEARRAVGLLSERYGQYRRSSPAGPVLAVDVQHWSGWSGDGS